MPDPAKGITPYLVAILLCDDVIEDSETHKKSLVGVFDTIFADSFPAMHQKLKIYVRMVNGKGKYDFRILYLKVETDEVLMKGDIPVEIPSGFKYYDLVITPPPINIPGPGEYEFRIFTNDQYIGRIRFAAEITGGKNAPTKYMA